MEALTTMGVRRLVKLYRREVEGAAEQIDDLIEHRGDHLRSVLGNLAFNGTDRVEQLAQWVEQTSRRRSVERAQADHDKVGRLALDLVAQAAWIGPDRLRLDPATLAELVACRSFDWLVLDSIALRGAERRRLRAFFRECKRVRDIEVEVGPNGVLIHYGTSKGSGQVRFWLEPTPIRAVPLVIEWSGRYESPSLAQPCAAETVPDFAHASPVEPADAMVLPEQDVEVADRTEHGPELPDSLGTDELAADVMITPSPRAAPSSTTSRRSPKPRHGFLRHLLEAASEVTR